MTYENRIRQLERLHQDIDNKIDVMEKNHPGVQETLLHDLKKQRLTYRDELSRLRRQQYEQSQIVDFDDDR
jgi:hypothetical protein